MLRRCETCGCVVRGVLQCYTCERKEAARGVPPDDKLVEDIQRKARRIGWAGLWLFQVGWFVLIAASLCSALGCTSMLESMPAGMNAQVSTTGFRVSPGAVDGPLILGQSTWSIQTPAPTDSGPSLNRNHVKAGLSGIEITSTVGTGPVGEQINAMGGPAALGLLLQPSASESPPSDPVETRTRLGFPAAIVTETVTGPRTGN